MTFCLDESGIHDGAEICLIGGYFGGAGQWKKLSKAWKQKLADFEVPLEEFHAKDLAKSNGFFHKWTQDDSYKLGSRSPVQSQNLSFTP